MPPPRRSSPRRRDRRSRSRSFSPRPYSPPRQSYSRRSPKNERRSPPRNRSRSPKRRSLSMDRGRPVKRVPADSSGRHMGYRSRSPSPVPAKRVFKEHKQETSGRRQSDKYSPERTQWRDRSASPSRQHRRASFEGKMYADKPSSSKIPEKEKSEIASVKIIDTHKREKLDKRFRTLEQLSQGPFDFEENITIGIHRGPQHMELAEDVPANYDIDMRSFVMLFPKRDKPQRIFDRDEIRAFRHDDILDEEAYVEKRTITMRPSEKQQRKYSDMDYKITIGHSSSSRDYDSDRRMVRDVSGKQTTRPSWNEADVTVRLDPKPDPRYERIYQDSQKKDDAHSSVQRNPNDLRHNLERRHKSHSGGDRDREYRSERDRDYDTKDARYQIESHRRGGGGGRSNERPRDRYRDDGVSSRPDDEVKRKPVKTELPDFKNRPVSPLRLPHVWIIGSSLVKDTQKYVQENSIGTDLSLQELLASVHWHGEMDMKIEDVLAAVHFLKKAHPAPQMIVIHCGDNNVCEGRNVDSHEVMQRDLKVIQEEFPGVRIVWSQILPTWNKSGIRPSTMSKSRRRINKFVGNDVLDFNGCLLLYPEFSSGEKQKLYLESSDGGFHLTNLGMKMFITRLRSGIKYFIEGHGTVFPYLKWPPEDITELSKTSIPMLNFDQVQDLKKKQLHKLSAKQIQAFTLEQIKMFSNHQVSEFDMQLCVSLTREQITGLTLKQVKLLSPKQFLYFKPEQVKWFTEEQNKVLKKMDMSEVERLKDERRERERKEAGSLRPPGEEEAVIKESRDRGRARRSRSPVRKGDTSRDRKSGRVRRSPSPVSRRTIRSREWSGRGRVRRSPSPGSRNSRDRGGDPGRQQWQGGRRASSGGGYTPSRRGRRRSSSSSSSGSRSPVGPRHNWSWHDGWPRQPDSYPSPYSVPPGVPHYPGLPGPAPFPQAGMPPHIPHPFPLSGPYAPPPGAPLPGVPLAPGAAPPLAPYAVAPGWPPQLPPGVHIVHPGMPEPMPQLHPGHPLPHHYPPTLVEIPVNK